MKRLPIITVPGLALLIACATVTAQPSSYTPFPKSRALTLADDAPVPSIFVKFHEGTSIRIRSGALTAMRRSPRDEADLMRLRLDRATVSKDLAAVTALLSEPPLVGQVLRAYGSVTETELQTLRSAGESASAVSLPDLDLNVELPLARGTTFRHVKPILDALNMLDSVEVAWAPLPGSPASTDSTPSFEWRQKYLPWQGINALDSWEHPGGRGTNVRLCDVEYGWNRNHESLTGVQWVGSGVNYAEQGDAAAGCRSAAHGNAVLSMVGARRTGVGVTGVAPEATIGVQPAGAAGFTWNYERYAVVNAAKWACDVDPQTGVVRRPGGVVLIEVQLYVPCPPDDQNCVSGVIAGCVGPDGLSYYSHRWFPLEYGDPFGRQDIITAAALKAVVVEAAGNGGEVLDTADYPDSSGAIMVAASQIDLNGNPAAKECYSNSGSRIDLHAWGGVPGWADATDYSRAAAGGPCYFSSGAPTYWADLQNNGPNASYTRSFGGTSAASAIVAGVAADIQGQALARLSNRPLSSRDLLVLLKTWGRVGAVDDPSSDNYIGKMPDLQAARLALPVARFTESCSGLACTFNSSTSNPSISNYLRFRWNFGNGFTPWQTTPTIAHNFATYQSYPVSLEIADPSQIGDAIQRDVTLVPAQGHDISGTVTLKETALPGVTVTAGSASAVTGALGGYTIPGLSDGPYTVTPTHCGYTFTPTSSPVIISGSSLVGVDFEATPRTFTISGRVTKGGITIGRGDLAGVTVSAGGHSATTNARGFYMISGLTNGDYIVAATLPGYTFSPATSSVSIKCEGVTDVNFLATAVYSISGSVTVGGSGLAGVVVTAGSASATTNASGIFTIFGVPDGAYTVVPRFGCYTFSPSSVLVNVSGANVTGTAFAAGVRPCGISGTVTEGGIGLAGVTILAETETATTDASGAFAFSFLELGGHTLTPALAGYGFAPASALADFFMNAVTVVNFSATAQPTYTISGDVRLGSGGLAGVKVSAVRGPDASGAYATYATTTNAAGGYVISGLLSGTYVVNCSMVGYTLIQYEFTPSSSTQTISGENVAGVNFTALVSSGEM
jgi:hypothetical protein